MKNSYAAVHGGGTQALEQVIQKYKSTVYAIALTRLKNRDDADDVFQEVFIAYWRKKPVFKSEEHRKAWLITVTLNHTKKLLYKNRKFSESIDASQPVYEFTADSDTALYSAILSLEEKYRTVLYLHYFEDMTALQIGKVLGLKESAVRMRLMRARESIKQQLGGDYFE